MIILPHLREEIPAPYVSTRLSHMLSFRKKSENPRTDRVKLGHVDLKYLFQKGTYKLQTHEPFQEPLNLMHQVYAWHENLP